MLQFLAMQQSRFALSILWVTACVTTGAIACVAEPTPTAEATPASSPIEAPVATAQGEEEQVPEDVVNYTRVDATVACAGATPPDAMAGLKDLGFAAIINFRTEGERGATVQAGMAAAEAAGLKYHHLPFSRPSAEVTEAFLEVVADPANQPAYIHCGSANRVGAMWLIKRVKLDGWSVEDATAEAEAIGLRSEGLKAFALEYLEDGV